MEAQPDEPVEGVQKLARFPFGSVVRTPRLLFACGSLAAVAALAFGLLACRRKSGDSGHPNLVLIVIDTLRQDHLACYGYHRNPAPGLDKLAREGAIVEALSPTSWTKPAIASLFTGLHPVRHQTFGRKEILPKEVVTLAEVLSAAGYHTLGATANGWIDSTFGFDQGFDGYYLYEKASAPDLDARFAPELAKLHEPFFLYVHYLDPHAPYEPATAWDGSPLSPDLLRQRPIQPKDLDAMIVRKRPHEFVQAAVDLYDGEIRQADDGVSWLLGRLEKAGLLKDTVIIVTADHGEEFEDHGRMSHGHSLYQEVVKVPLIFHYPRRIPEGTRVKTGSLLDVFDTALELLHVVPPGRPGDRDGISLGRDLTGAIPQTTGTEREFLLHLDYEDGTSLALLKGNRILVLGKKPYRKELFDLGRDPSETHNLLSDPSEQRTISELAEALAVRYNAYSRKSYPDVRMAQESETVRRLVALGYVTPTAGVADRTIPRMIHAADLDPVGALGWEKPDPHSCLRMADPRDQDQLLLGWFPEELGGRWMSPRASLEIGVPRTGSSSLRISLEGQSFRTDSADVQVWSRGRLILRGTVPTGPFSLNETLPGVFPEGSAVLQISADPPFRPSEHGSADQRELGLFFRSICLSGSPSRP